MFGNMGSWYDCLPFIVTWQRQYQYFNSLACFLLNPTGRNTTRLISFLLLVPRVEGFLGCNFFCIALSLPILQSLVNHLGSHLYWTKLISLGIGICIKRTRGLATRWASHVGFIYGMKLLEKSNSCCGSV